MPDTRFVPEVPHARVQLDAVRVDAAQLLPGDGYDSHVKPFRTLEDTHVALAVLAYLLREARQRGWPPAFAERLCAVLAALAALAQRTGRRAGDAHRAGRRAGAGAWPVRRSRHVCGRPRATTRPRCAGRAMRRCSAWPQRPANNVRPARGNGCALHRQADMRLRQILFSQGFGTRRECEALIWHALVQVGERVLDDPDEELDTNGLVFSVRGQPWPFHAKALLMMNKPAGYECSRKPRHHPSVLSLLPAPLRQREVQPIGRLDEDTTGLLLFTDDGALIHKLTSPKWHVPKVYVADCADAVETRQVQQLLDGVVLHDDPLPVRAAACEATAERQLRLTLDRRQVPPGQAHDRRRGQPCAAHCAARPSVRCSCRPTWQRANGAGSSATPLRRGFEALPGLVRRGQPGRRARLGHRHVFLGRARVRRSQSGCLLSVGNVATNSRS